MVFCIAPFVNFSTRTNGKIRACCQADTFEHVHVHDNDVQSIWMSDEYQLMRKEFLNGRWPAQCSHCETNKKMNISTRMDLENERWKHLDWDELKHSPQIHSYDLRMGNTCNLKCVMCHPTNSSLWYSDYKNFDHLKDYQHNVGLKWAINDYLLDQIKENLTTVQLLYFSGGEPLLIKKHRELIKFCIDNNHAPNIKLIYDTNATKINEKWIEFWKHFRHVQINFSIDGNQRTVEYIRFPVQYTHLLKSMELLHGTPFDVHLQFSLGAYNIHDIDHIFALKDQFEFGTVNINIVKWPTFLSAHNLPDHMKIMMKSKYNRHHHGHLVNYIQSWKEDGQTMSQMKEYFKGLDKIRGTNYKETFPWM